MVSGGGIFGIIVIVAMVFCCVCLPFVVLNCMGKDNKEVEGGQEDTVLLKQDTCDASAKDLMDSNPNLQGSGTELNMSHSEISSNSQISESSDESSENSESSEYVKKFIGSSNLNQSTSLSNRV